MGAVDVDLGQAGAAAWIVLLAADGTEANEVVRRTGRSKPTVIAWECRYAT